MTDTEKALEALDNIVTAYCMSLGMNPPRPDQESQTAKQVETIRVALSRKEPERVEYGALIHCYHKWGVESIFSELAKDYPQGIIITQEKEK